MSVKVVCPVIKKEAVCLSSFSELPTEIITIIITYLTILEWSDLDIVLCTHCEIREKYLHALKSGEILVNIDFDWLKTKISEIKLLNWLVARGIRVVSWKNIKLSLIKTEKIAKKLSFLQKLTIGGSKLRDKALAAIANGFPNLNTLIIESSNRITDDGIKAIANGRLINLNLLHILSCNRITDTGICDMAGGNLHNLKSLRIDISNRLGNTAVAAIANSFSNLDSLDITCSRNLSNEALSILANGNLHNLLSLDISGCGKVSDNGLVALANGCGLGKLQSLDVSCTSGMKNAGLAAIANGRLCNLQLLNIGLTNITDLGLVSIMNGTGLPKLQRLIIAGCKHTDMGLMNLKQRLPHLQIRV